MRANASQEGEVRRDLAAAYRLNALDGMDDGIDTHISARLADDLGDHSAMILRQHGLLTCGQNVGDAFLRMRNLERSCQAQLAAQATGQTLRSASSSMAEHAAQQYATWAASPAGNERAWQAEKRRLDGADDSF